MTGILKHFFVDPKSEQGDFRMGAAVVISLLILTYLGAIIYILVSSLGD